MPGGYTPGRPFIFQFTPLREGRHLYTRAVCLCLDISIHAPPRGATLRRTRFWRLARYFNSRPSARGDDCNPHGRGAGTVSTITPPPRGAPSAPSTMAGLSSYFNSRPSARGDAHPHSCIRTARIFQFTPLREGRRFRCSTSAATPYFNSRPSARGDPHPHPIIHRRSLFQFTPLREGRPCPVDRRGQIYNFNSRPSARGDSNEMRKLQTNLISIHAPPRGATKS